MATTQVLFLHHLNPKNRAVTEFNFNSFLRCGNDVLGLHDSDSEGLPGSFSVPVNHPLPRGNRWTSPDVVFLNYLITNRHLLSHDKYMFCEYDCYCECNIDLYCSEYSEFDVCVPEIVTMKEDPGWGWFNDILIDCNMVGFRPATFLLFSKDAALKVAAKYMEVWDCIKDSNCEARLGSICEILGLKVGRFNDLMNNVSWGPTKFRRNMKFYHPVKTHDIEKLFIPKPKSSEFSGVWLFGREKNYNIATVILERDGTIANYENYNEVYWYDDDQGRIIFCSGRGAITSIFQNVKTDGSLVVGDHYDGNISCESLLFKNYHWIRKVNF